MVSSSSRVLCSSSSIAAVRDRSVATSLVACIAIAIAIVVNAIVVIVVIVVNAIVVIVVIIVVAQGTPSQRGRGDK
jgi:hypothetical protein